MDKLLILIILTIAFIVGGIVASSYGIEKGVIAGSSVLMYGLLAFLCMFLGFVPFVGPYLYYWMIKFKIEPIIYPYTLQAFPLLSIVYWIFFLFSILICCAVTFGVLLFFCLLIFDR